MGFAYAYPMKDRIVIQCSYLDKQKLKDSGLPVRWDTRFKRYYLPLSVTSYKEITNHDIDIADSLHERFADAMKVVELNRNSSFEQFTFKTSPREHQKEGGRLILDYLGSMLLFDVGVGKSKTLIDAVTYLYSIGKLKKCLVVSPACVMYNFAVEVEKHSPLRPVVIDGTPSKKVQLIQNSTEVFQIISYSIIGKLGQEIRKANFDLMAFDEIHYLKNKDSNRTKAAYYISRDVERRVGMTGTMITKNRADAFAPFMVVDERVFGNNYNLFQNRYLVMGGFRAEVKDRSTVPDRPDWMPADELDALGLSNEEFAEPTKRVPTQVIGNKEDDEFKRLVASISLKYDIDDVVDLPPVVEVPRYFALDDNTFRIHEEMRQHYMCEAKECLISASNILDRILNLQKICSGFIEERERLEIGDKIKISKNGFDIGRDKLDVLLHEVESIGDKKIIIWCRFSYSIDRVLNELIQAGYSCCVYDGRTSKTKSYTNVVNRMITNFTRGKTKDMTPMVDACADLEYRMYQGETLYNAFNASDKCQIMISQIQMGIGWSVPNAKYNIFYELNHNYGDLKQAKGRSRRIVGSEKGSCVYIYLLARNAADSSVYQSMKTKSFTASDALEFVMGGRKN